MATVEERVVQDDVDSIAKKRSSWQDNKYMAALTFNALTEVIQRLAGGDKKEDKDPFTSVIELRGYLVEQFSNARDSQRGIVQELLSRETHGIKQFMDRLENVIRKFPPYINTDAFSGTVELRDLKEFLSGALVVFRKYSDRAYP